MALSQLFYRKFFPAATLLVLLGGMAWSSKGLGATDPFIPGDSNDTKDEIKRWLTFCVDDGIPPFTKEDLTSLSDWTTGTLKDKRDKTKLPDTRFITLTNWLTTNTANAQEWIFANCLSGPGPIPGPGPNPQPQPASLVTPFVFKDSTGKEWAEPLDLFGTDIDKNEWRKNILNKYSLGTITDENKILLALELSFNLHLTEQALAAYPLNKKKGDPGTNAITLANAQTELENASRKETKELIFGYLKAFAEKYPTKGLKVLTPQELGAGASGGKPGRAAGGPSFLDPYFKRSFQQLNEEFPAGFETGLILPKKIINLKADCTQAIQTWWKKTVKSPTDYLTVTPGDNLMSRVAYLYLNGAPEIKKPFSAALSPHSTDSMTTIRNALEGMTSDFVKAIPHLKTMGSDALLKKLAGALQNIATT